MEWGSDATVGPTVGRSGREVGGVQSGLEPRSSSHAMALVLNGLKKQRRGLGSGGVVAARGINVEHLPPEDPFAAANVANASEPLIEVIAAPGSLEPVVVHREPLDQILAQAFRRPDAELRAALRPDAIANRQNRRKAITVNRTGNLATSLGLNDSEFPNSCRGIDLAILIDIFQMLVDRGDRHRNSRPSTFEPATRSPEPFRLPAEFVRLASARGSTLPQDRESARAGCRSSNLLAGHSRLARKFTGDRSR